MARRPLSHATAASPLQLPRFPGEGNLQLASTHFDTPPCYGMAGISPTEDDVDDCGDILHIDIAVTIQFGIG